MAVETILTELMAIPGPTGRESLVMDWLRERWQGHAESVWDTKVWQSAGARRRQRANPADSGTRRRAVARHPLNRRERLLWLSNGQAPSTNVTHRYPVGQPALVVGRHGQIDGLFAAASGHILTVRQRDTERVDLDTLFVDIGAASRAEAVSMGAHVGASIVWNTPPRRLGNRLYGKAIDDRVALALMLTELIETVSPDDSAYDLYLAATIQEEIGLVGSLSLRADVDADLAIALDNGLVGDIPTVSSGLMPTVLGGGPTLVYKDAHVHYDIRLIDRLTDIASERDIPVQHAVYEQIGSDGSALIKQGIPTALLGPATRYTHSAFEMIDVRDLDSSLDLLAAFVTSAP
ncbi:MAG: M20/M25/M40 family metallo-hydrolase [Thermomicrobiales bacterium]|nr:M20/M25/M40 family metallo-hydrolase [Thermomicrobiales bacterium]